MTTFPQFSDPNDSYYEYIKFSYIRDQLTASFENNALLQDNPSGGLFYYDSAGLNIGFGYNITANLSTNQTPRMTLQSVGLVFSDDQWKEISAAASISSEEYSKASSSTLLKLAAPLNMKLASLAASTYSTTISQSQAFDLMDRIYNKIIYADTLKTFKYYKISLPFIYTYSITSAGISDEFYNTDKGRVPIAAFGSTPAKALALGDLGSLAVQTAFFTNKSNTPGLETRRLAEAFLQLGGVATVGNVTIGKKSSLAITDVNFNNANTLNLVNFEQSVIENPVEVTKKVISDFNKVSYALGNKNLITTLLTRGYFVPEVLSSWDSIAEQAVATISGLSNLAGVELQSINSVLPGSNLTAGGLVYVPTGVVGTSSSFLSLSASAAIVLDTGAVNDPAGVSPTAYMVSSSLDGSDEGALFVILQDGTSMRYDANTWQSYSLVTVANGDATVQVALMAPGQILVATLTIDTVDDTASVTLPDNYNFSVPNIATNTDITDPVETPEEVLIGYLTDLGYSTSASEIADLDSAYHNPTGKAYTVKGTYGGTAIGGKTIEDFTVKNSAPGAVVTGISGDTNVVLANGDISEDTFDNVQTLSIGSAVQLRSDQFDLFDAIVGGFDSTLTVTTEGTASIADVSANIGTLVAQSWGDTILIGNDHNGQTLQASLFGDDTLEAGDGEGDALVAGEGVDMLAGGTGGDTFIADNGLAAGSAVIGSGTGNVLRASGDISQASVSGIQEIEGGSAGLNADEFAGFTTINASGLTITAMTGGTYDLTEKIVLGVADLVAASAEDTIFIGDGNFTATGNGNDTLVAGDAAGDILSATGNGNDILSAGNGAGDKVSASGSGNNTLSAGDGSGDVLGATGTGTNTLTTGNGNNDVLTASNGTDTLVSGTGSGDTLTVTTGGNTLIAKGSSAVLTAKGGGNTLMSGAKGATFDLYDDDNTATGGSGNDTFDLMGPSSGSGQSGDLTGTTIDGGGGINTIDAQHQALDLSGATVSNIQSIVNYDIDDYVILTPSELAGLTSLKSGTGTEYIEASTPGIYSAVGLTNTDAVEMFDKQSGGGVTLTDTNAAGNLLESTQNSDTLNSGNGNGDYVRLDGGNSSATIGTGTGDKVVVNGSNDAVLTTGATATVTLAGLNGIATLRGTNDTTQITGSGAKHNTVNIQGSGDTINDVSYGGSSFVVGGSVAATGATLNGTPTGLDNYTFAANFGQDTVNNHGSFGFTATGQIFFTAGVTDQNLWFQRAGNNLQIDFMGTAEHVTVLNWFSSIAAQVGSIILSNGYQLANTRVAALVSAMAAYASANPSFNPTTTSAAPSNTALQNAVTTAWNSTITITDTAADVSLEIDLLQSLAAAGQLSAISLTDGTSAPLAITGTQLASDAAALSKISGTYTLSLSQVPAASAVSDAADAHIITMAVTDTADDVAANLDNLQVSAAAGKLSSITLTDGGTLFITAAQMTGDAAALAKISGTYDLSLSAVSASTASSESAVSSVMSLSVSDTAANVLANITALQALAAGGELASITLTDPGIPTIVVTPEQLATDVAAFGEITKADGQPAEFSLSGNTTVSGSDTTLDVGNNTLGIGDSSAATLTIDTDASIFAGEIDLGADAAGTGTVVVDGSGTVLEGDTVAVGGSATASGDSGELTVSNGAVVSVDNLDVWENGQVTLDDGDLDTDPVTMSGGTISGNGVIAGDITGSGKIIASGGTLELTGAVSGSNTLVITAGATLLLDAAVASGVTVEFQSGGTGVLELADPSDMQGTIIGQSPGDQVVDVACFVVGTRILTDRGEVAVEDLEIGDLVVTVLSHFTPIRWIGRRSYNGRFVAGNHLMLPICIKAGAFADGVPIRDLHVSPGHAMFVDRQLVPAWRLVNGVSIVQAEAVESVTYYHVELDRHAIILAEGALAESYLDDKCRGQFQNADEYHRLYPDTAAMIPLQSRLEDGFGLQALQERIAVRAGVFTPIEPLGPLRGFVDMATPEKVCGWAQDVESPEEPVALEVLIGGSPVVCLLANAYRADLRQAGFGSGCHAFETELPPGFSGRVEVRRIVDALKLQRTAAAVGMDNRAAA